MSIKENIGQEVVLFMMLEAFLLWFIWHQVLASNCELPMVGGILVGLGGGCISGLAYGIWVALERKPTLISKLSWSLSVLFSPVVLPITIWLVIAVLPSIIPRSIGVPFGGGYMAGSAVPLLLAYVLTAVFEDFQRRRPPSSHV